MGAGLREASGWEYGAMELIFKYFSYDGVEMKWSQGTATHDSNDVSIRFYRYVARQDDEVTMHLINLRVAPLSKDGQEPTERGEREAIGTNISGE